MVNTGMTTHGQALGMNHQIMWHLYTHTYDNEF